MSRGLGDVYKRQIMSIGVIFVVCMSAVFTICLLYTSPSPRDMRRSRIPSSA
ncbi:hypothetical protein JMUB7535_26960 [Staphylococcus aureus]